MNDASKDLVDQGELHLGKRQLGEAGRCFEAAAGLESDGAGRAVGLKRAAAAFLEDRSIGDAGRCYWQLSGLLEKQDKADTLMVYWRALILAIAGSRWECNFEWKGEAGHHEEHLAHEREVQEFQGEAQRVLAEVLRTKGVDRGAVLEAARAECRRRQQEGGWGASECQAIIAGATGG